MLFVPVIRRSALMPSLRGVDRFLREAAREAARSDEPADRAQDDKAYLLSFDMPGVSREQLSIGIEGNVVRLETLPEAKRQYKAAYELPQDIDVSASEAKLEHGMLTLKLAKAKPESKAVKLTVN